MPQVTIKAVAGRTIEQKRAVVKDFTESLVKHFKVNPQNVVIEIIEITRDNIARAGELFSDREVRP